MCFNQINQNAAQTAARCSTAAKQQEMACSCKFTVGKKIALSEIQNVYSACYNVSFIRKRAISLQKVHLWMDCGKRILWSWTQSKATKIRAATVQSSVWTLQQILPDELPDRLYMNETNCTFQVSFFLVLL